MPKQKDLKRLTRTRMQKTGESYTAARARLLARRDATKHEPTHDFESRAGMSEAAVRRRTGKGWAEWVRVLDAIDAARRPHREIAAWLHDEHGLSGWWSQGVTVGYERIRGLREIGQRRGGAYEANKSRTFPVAVETLYGKFADPRKRSRWLPGVKLVVRATIPNKSIRAARPDGTTVQFYFVPKGAAKCQVAVQHAKLRTKADVAAAKVFWGERLAALAEALV